MNWGEGEGAEWYNVQHASPAKLKVLGSILRADLINLFTTKTNTYKTTWGIKIIPESLNDSEGAI